MSKRAIPQSERPQLAFNPNVGGNGIIAILIGLLQWLFNLLAQRGIIIVGG